MEGWFHMKAQKKIAHSKRAPKRRTNKHQNSGKAVEQRPARSKAGETPLPSGLIAMAAARAGITTPELEACLRIPPRIDPAVVAAEEAERARIAAAIGPRLVLACDQLGEEIAAIADSAGGAGRGGDDHNVVDVLLNLWKIRWELLLTPNAVVKADEDDDSDEQATDGAA
jgi:hypothetical protein